MELNEIVKRSKKSENQKSVINDIKKLYESRERIIRLFDHYSRILSEVKYKTNYGEGLKILSSK